LSICNADSSHRRGQVDPKGAEDRRDKTAEAIREHSEPEGVKLWLLSIIFKTQNLYMKSFLFLILAVVCLKTANAQESWFDNSIKAINQAPIQQEKENGVRPNEHKKVGQWSPFIKQDMNEIWESLGLKGVNYYCVGEPEKNNDYIQRNDFKSKYYQGWFGVYMIEAKRKLFDYPNDSLNSVSFGNINNLLSIAVMDQTSWLYAMGDTSALTSTSIIESKESFQPVDKIYIDGHYAPVFEFQMNSHSDITDKMSDMTKVFAMPKKDYWGNQLSAYHNITVKGCYIYWYNKIKQTLTIIYGSGCSFATKDLKRYDTYPLIKNEILDMIKSIGFLNVK